MLASLVISISFNSSGKLSFSSLFCSAYQRPLIIKHGLNTRLNDKTSCSRDCIHFRLSVGSRITASMYLCRQIELSLLAPHHSQVNCIYATLNKIVELNMSLVLLFCSIQFLHSWSAVIPFVDTWTKFTYTIMKAVLINHISNVNPHVRPHFLTMVTDSYISIRLRRSNFSGRSCDLNCKYACV